VIKIKCPKCNKDIGDMRREKKRRSYLLKKEQGKE